MGLKFGWDDVPEVFDEDCEVNKLGFKKHYDCKKGEAGYFFVSGDNYPVLKLLVSGNGPGDVACNEKGGFPISGKESVDLIYIDPPYNTGNFFVYNDDFTAGGDRHSCWLSFMVRRLRLARELLKNSGCIFIAIDQSELYVLKLLCDQVFGEDNFVNDFMWLHGKGKKDAWSRTLQQHTLCYAKNKKNLGAFSDFEVTSWAKSNIDNDERGNWFSGSISFTEARSNSKHPNFYEIKSPSGKKWKRQWFVKKSEMDLLLKDKKIYFGPGPDFAGVPRIKVFDGETSEIIPKNIIDCVESTRSAQKHLDDLLGQKKLFDNPKPVDLIEHLIFITQMKKDCVILDFFAGSGTTLEAVKRLNDSDGGNRKCVLVQKPEKSQKDDSISIDEICWRRISAVCDDVVGYRLVVK